MAYLAVHDKKAQDEKLAAFLPLIEKHSYDERNFVKKAVNWALRQIGKRNLNLNRLAIETAERVKLQDTKPARWIAADALRELTSKKILERLKNKEIRRSAAIRQ
jgi:3-methyladenine DNA glycosylase AlkD